ncbi:hypothetical protein HT031_006704 [Scenedesmus sp. PABB004]|nr:hypothetical protein HT031_006704 [Scenedesmus sp. PABB004]
MARATLIAFALLALLTLASAAPQEGSVRRRRLLGADAGDVAQAAGKALGTAKAAPLKLLSSSANGIADVANTAAKQAQRVTKADAKVVAAALNGNAGGLGKALGAAGNAKLTAVQRTLGAAVSAVQHQARAVGVQQRQVTKAAGQAVSTLKKAAGL